ncbi:mannitol dehydrogenase family protein [Azohydromonas lata]|uniref:Mannitol dehydrogenase family protein n=1 Tax=Azohydromonas lata TaxID=45677 RepID=A0ABU5ID57_9BURK|nr:mannitol dehydrogenase family protein [Azohydromonas lata]MDZ5455898.1 mannitol dehydrogenase family protein [Azohydromonas lata]
MSLLSPESLAELPATVQRPAYERGALRSGIVHLGLGAFQRAHQALYTEAALADGDLRWGTVGVSLRGPGVPRTLAAQAGLYAVTERHADTAHTRVVGGLREALFAPAALERVLGALADPGVALVTTTVTEKGYSQHPASGELDVDDPDIRHDLAHPDAPRSTLGVLAAGLRRRPAGAPITVVCCDNMAANGRTLQRLLGQYAQQVDAGLARRIEHDIAFPNTMVDRIVPAATPASLDWAQARLGGLRDEAAIVCEPFTQWVIEDRFSSPRPAWEAGGALFTADVRPYQAMKLRLLNGTHSAIAYLGQLRGLQTVADAMADPLLGGFARALMTQDLLATVDVPAGYDARAYCRELIHRFENPALGHRTQQIAMDGTQKVPVRWLPALRESLARGVERPFLERALAAWLHYLGSGRDDAGAPLALSDPGAQALAQRLQAAGSAHEAVAAALEVSAVFGREPWAEAFMQRLAGHLAVLRRGGALALLAPGSRH